MVFTDEETSSEGTPLLRHTSQFLQSFSLLEPPSPSDMRQAHLHTSHSSSIFQPPSHLMPPVSAGLHAESLMPAMLLDLQPHDRESYGQESHEQSDLLQSDSCHADTSHRQAPGSAQPVATSGTQQWPGQLLSHAQTDRIPLGASAAPAVAASPHQLGELEVDLPQLSSCGHTREEAAEEELPFAVSRSSSGDRSHLQPSSSSASHASLQRDAVSTGRPLSVMQMSDEEVVDQPAGKASLTDAWDEIVVLEQGSLDAAALLEQNRGGHQSSAAVVIQSSNLQSTAGIDTPPLPAMTPELEADTEAAPQLTTGVDGLLHLPVNVVAGTLQHRATDTAQPPPELLVADLLSQVVQIQLPAVATTLMPGSPTGALLPGTGADLLDRPGSSPLPVSKLLRMVSEDQASLLSDLAAQCAAPGGLLGSAPAGQVQPDPTGALEAAPSQATCSPSDQAVVLNAMGSQSSLAQHGQRVLRRHTSPRLESSAAASHQTSTSSPPMSSSLGPITADSPAQSAQAHTSPLRRKLSQFFSPIFGSISPQRPHAQQSDLQQPLLLSASQSQTQSQTSKLQQQQQSEEAVSTGHAHTQHGLPQLSDMQPGVSGAWEMSSLHQPAATLLAASQSAVLSHSAFLCFPAMMSVCVLSALLQLAVDVDSRP